MRMGPGLHVTGGNASRFSPLAMFAGAAGLWYDPSDLSTLFQDDAGATPVTASGQTVGRMLDKSGGGVHAVQATAAARPLFVESGGIRFLTFDGVDDFMSLTLTRPTSWTNAMAYRKASATGRAVGLGSTGATSTVGVTDQTTQRLNTCFGSVAAAGALWQGAAAGGGKTTFGVMTGCNIGDAAAEIYYNKASQTVSLQTGSLTLQAAFNALGRSGSGYSAMDFAGLVLRTPSLDTSGRESAETWLMARVGL